ncbi:MAG: carboxypeptidase-like regulatory domain-containing protein, partial [bacterium]
MNIGRILLIIFLTLEIGVSAQNKTLIKGRVINEAGNPLELVNIIISGNFSGTTTSPDGFFEIAVAPESPVILQFSHLEYIPKEKTLTNLDTAKEFLIITLEKRIREVSEVEVTAKAEDDQSAQRLKPELS